MPRTPEQLEQIKVLFKKLYDAHRYTQAHPAIENPEQFKKVVDAVDDWCDELEALGVNRIFSMCIYTFGTDYQICYDMVNNANLTSNE